MEDFSYKTKVRVSLPILREVVSQAERDYLKVNTRETSEGRSLFSRWNNTLKFYERLQVFNDDYPVIDVTGSAKGGTSRVYFKPSVTSLSKDFRKSIIPLTEGNIIAYFDLKAAEFFMNCVFAQEQSAVSAYHNGDDVYMHFAPLFPNGTSRKTIKTLLIANLYGVSDYRVAKDLGITETQAQRLLQHVSYSLPRLTELKRHIISYDLRHKGYYAPNGFDQTNLIRIGSIDPVKGFNENYALSAYTQSALGFFMQSLTLKLLPRVQGTLLSVFDSMFVEIQSESLPRFKDWLDRNLSPFRYGSLTTGSTAYEAAYGSN